MQPLIPIETDARLEDGEETLRERMPPLLPIIAHMVGTALLSATIILTEILLVNAAVRGMMERISSTPDASTAQAISMALVLFVLLVHAILVFLSKLYGSIVRKVVVWIGTAAVIYVVYQLRNFSGASIVVELLSAIASEDPTLSLAQNLTEAISGIWIVCLCAAHLLLEQVLSAWAAFVDYRRSKEELDELSQMGQTHAQENAAIIADALTFRRKLQSELDTFAAWVVAQCQRRAGKLRGYALTPAEGRPKDVQSLSGKELEAMAHELESVTEDMVRNHVLNAHPGAFRHA